MKYQFIPNKDKKSKIELPALFQRNGSILIVFFKKENEGMVVIPSVHFGLGYYSDTWANCFDTSVWTPLSPGEKVILENS